MLAALAVLFAGCATEEPADEPGAGDGDGAGDGAGDGTGNGGTDAEASIESVSVTSAPDSVAAGEEAIVCWRVEGSGNIPHTAVHFDSESHPGDDVTFGDYAGGAVYPGNTTGEAPEGYDLPGDFCAALTPPDGAETVYLRAHAMIEPQGIVSEEQSIPVAA